MPLTHWQRYAAAFVVLSAVGMALAPARAAEPPTNTPLPRGALLRLGGPEGDTRGREVQAVAFAPDGKLLATAHADSVVRLWDSTTGKLVRTLTGHAESVRCVAFSPDGKTLVSGGLDRTARLWDATTGKELRALTDLPAAVWSVAFSPDGTKVAPGFADKTAWLWEVAAGKPLPTPGPRGQQLAAVAFSPDGRLLASASAGRSDHVIHLWDAASGAQVRTLPGHDGPVTSLALSADGNTLASGSNDGSLRLWNTATGGSSRTLDSDQFALPTWVAFAPDGKTLAAARADGAIRLYETATGQFVREGRGTGSGITSLAFSPDGAVLAASYRDGTAFVWAVNGWGRSPPAELMQDYLFTAWWSFLAGTDVPQAYEAVWYLAAHPAAVPFLEKRLAQVVWPDPRRVAALVADLDSDAYAVRQAASDELGRQLESVAGPALRRVLAGRPSLEMHQRIDLLLRQYDQRGLLPEESRALRGVQVLEQIGTPAARQALTRLAGAGGDNRLTQEARMALERLGKRPPTTP